MYRIAVTVDPEIAVPPVIYGGIERIAYHLVEGLIDRGHEVVLLSSADSNTRATQRPYSATHSRGLFNTIINMSTLARQTWRQPVDVIHRFSRLAYLVPMMPSRIPKLMTYQREVTPRTVSLAHKLSQGSLSLSAVSKAMTHSTQNLFDWHIIPNMVDTHQFYPETNSVSPADSPLVFLGRIEAIKGVHVAIECALKTSRKLLIAGNVPDHDHAQHYFRTEVQPHLGEQVEYVGPVDDTAKRSLLSNAAALLMPILWDEPFGIVMAEALACATPVIALNRGAVPEVLEHGVSGYICENTQDMIAAIRQLPRLDRHNCRARAVECFSTDQVISAYERVYDQMTKTNNPGHLLQS